MPGMYVDVDSGETLGDCPDMTTLTHGQRAPLGGNADRQISIPYDLPVCAKNGIHCSVQEWPGCLVTFFSLKLGQASLKVLCLAQTQSLGLPINVNQPLRVNNTIPDHIDDRQVLI